jgi:hypothetical protein
MIDNDKTDDFPKLIPDESIRFEAKNEIRRAPELDFECSELEYRHILAEEDLPEKYTLRLAPNTETVMANKNSLKHKTSRHRVLWLSLTAAAAVFAFVLIISKNKTVDVPITVIASTTETDTETVSPDTVENKINIPVKKSGTTAKKLVSKPLKAKTVEQDITIEISETVDEISRPENIRIERITTAFAPVEMMNKEKTVFVYKPDYQNTPDYRAINRIVAIAEKINADVNAAKQNIIQRIDNFRIPIIPNYLSIDRGIDKEIDEWAKLNPDIPFTVFIDCFFENNMSEIYDENKKLVKVVFFTNRSLKYENRKTYHALNKF